MRTVEEILMVRGPDVIVAGSATTVLEAARLMAEGDVGSVIVRDNGRVVGIFTERDLLRKVIAVGMEPSAVPLSDAMSSPVKSCSLHDSLRWCSRELTDSHIRHLVVIEDGALVGLVGLRDILAAQLCGRDDEPEAPADRSETASVGRQDSAR